MAVKGFQTWEQWAAANGADVEAPPMPTREEVASVHENDDPNNPLVQKRRAWREWSDKHNQWLQYAERAGVTPEEMGKFNVHEQGQNLFSSWAQQWQQAQNSDPQARQFMSDPNFKAWVSTYKDPWVAYQNWQQKKFDTSSQASSTSISQLPGTNLWYTGGANGAFYDQFNRRVDNPGVIQSGGLTYTPGQGWTNAQGQAEAHPWQYMEKQGYSFGGPGGTAQGGPTGGASTGQDPLQGYRMPGTGGFSPGGNQAGALPSIPGGGFGGWGQPQKSGSGFSQPASGIIRGKG